MWRTRSGGEGQYDDALRISRRGSEFARSVDSRPYLGLFRKVSAQVLQETGDLEEAYKAIHESVGLLEPAPGNNNQGQRINFLLVLTIEGMILGGDQGLSLGRAKEALGPLERAFRIADEAVHRDPIDQGVRGSLENAGRELAHILRYSDPRPALDVYDHTLRHLAEIRDNPSFRRYEAENLAGSSYPLQRLGRSHEARQRLGAAFERLRAQKLYPADKVSPGSVTYTALRALADFEGADGNIPRALEIYRELLGLLRAGGIDPNSSLKDAVDLSNVYSAIAKLHRLNHAPQQADEISALRLDLWRGWDRKLPGNPFVRRQIEAATHR